LPERAAIAPELIAALADGRPVLALTGSGVSAESGVPTFRDARTGVWTRFRPEDLATPEAFTRDPGRVWEWYRWRRRLVREACPNPAHEALAGLARELPDFTLVTQNVDGLHQRAGSPAVIEFHGNLLRDRCHAGCGEVHVAPDAPGPPPCPRCGAPVRPDVVWFGEPIPEQALAGSFAAAERCSVFLSIGTSSLVYPAAGLAEIALRGGALLVEINPQPTPLSSLAEHRFEAPAAEVLPALRDALRPS